jgi:acetyl-CoA carboxylase biotin carboxyl carrier protein
MLFQINKLQSFLFSLTKYKIENIYIKSNKLQLIINTKKNQDSFLLRKVKSKKINKEASPEMIDAGTSSNINTINKEQSKYFTIVSPMIGTFYRSPAPNEEPFIKINDTVTINQTVCIIEAMKLMNEIESEVNGHIAEVLVEDGDIVDCGQALMRVKQD